MANSILSDSVSESGMVDTVWTESFRRARIPSALMATRQVRRSQSGNESLEELAEQQEEHHEEIEADNDIAKKEK